LKRQAVVLAALSQAIESRDPYARGHSAGTQFDPNVVRAFLNAWRAGELDRLLPAERLSA
jgi:hypothetical protein